MLLIKLYGLSTTSCTPPSTHSTCHPLYSSPTHPPSTHLLTPYRERVGREILTGYMLLIKLYGLSTTSCTPPSTHSTCHPLYSSPTHPPALHHPPSAHHLSPYRERVGREVLTGYMLLIKLYGYFMIYWLCGHELHLEKLSTNVFYLVSESFTRRAH